VRGGPELSLPPAAGWVRLESESALSAPSAGFSGVTQHVAYTDAAARQSLAAISASPSGPCAVLIPIKKSAAWWALAQDERLRRFHGNAVAPGHDTIGRAYAARIFRRLYHARYFPGSRWDFLTYFEFPVSETAAFQALLSELRDPSQNPEWEWVEAELELWLTKL
jgi:hypothetical protein